MKGNVNRVGRNELCPCGSGNKYKRCHGASEGGMSRGQQVAVGAAVVALVGGLLFIASSRPPTPAAQGTVWSPEHGHYH